MEMYRLLVTVILDVDSKQQYVVDLAHQPTISIR